MTNTSQNTQQPTGRDATHTHEVRAVMADLRKEILLDDALWAERSPGTAINRILATISERLTVPASKPGYVYVASSWRNPLQDPVVAVLRAAGIDCYDFKNPDGGTGFAWSSIDPDWMTWTPEQYIAALEHPLAIAGYESDFNAMQRADTFVLVLPCGRSAHLELGWAAGQSKRTAILTQDGEEPELMARMVDLITPSTHELLGWLGVQG
jgi:hypothetical protein